MTVLLEAVKKTVKKKMNLKDFLKKSHKTHDIKWNRLKKKK